MSLGDWPDPSVSVWIYKNDLETWTDATNDKQRVTDPNFLKANTGPYAFVSSKQKGWNIVTGHPNEVWYTVKALNSANNLIDVTILALDPKTGKWNTSPTKPADVPPTPSTQPGTMTISFDKTITDLLTSLVNAVVKYLNAHS